MSELTANVNALDQLLAYVVATIVQLPFFLLIASPWLAVAVGLMMLGKRRLTRRGRTVLGSGIAAIGLSPAYGAHMSMIPVYTLVISGDAYVVATTVSFFATWSLLLYVGLLLTRSKSDKGTRSN